jgi:methyltransferase
MLPVFLLAIVFLPMLAEARLSTQHERALRLAGATEPPDDVYAIMQIVYPACFIAMILEAALRRPNGIKLTLIGAAVFLAAKGLKYWAMAALGPRWTFRVLVPPGSQRTHAGPYQFLDHPNYAGVAGELLGVGLMAHAAVTAPLSLFAFSLLMYRRARVEERALGMRRR